VEAVDAAPVVLLGDPCCRLCFPGCGGAKQIEWAW
jgi:hypothetical protein